MTACPASVIELIFAVAGTFVDVTVLPTSAAVKPFAESVSVVVVATLAVAKTRVPVDGRTWVVVTGHTSCSWMPFALAVFCARSAAVAQKTASANGIQLQEV